MNQGFRLKPHKNYIGSVNAEVEKGYYWGVILDIPVSMEYSAETLEDLQDEFNATVEEYIRIASRF